MFYIVALILFLSSNEEHSFSNKNVYDTEMECLEDMAEQADNLIYWIGQHWPKEEFRITLRCKAVDQPV
jgi:hypothetical protein